MKKFLLFCCFQPPIFRRKKLRLSKTRRLVDGLNSTSMLLIFLRGKKDQTCLSPFLFFLVLECDHAVSYQKLLGRWILSSSFFDTICGKLRRILQTRHGSRPTTRFGISDVIQESAIQVWRHVDQNNLSESKIDTRWLRSVAVGHYCKSLRFHLAAKRNMNTEARLGAASCFSNNDDPAMEHEQRDRAIHLMACIETLEPLKRQIVFARFFQELTLPQIATETGLTIHGTRKRLQEAISNLRSAI